MNTVQAADDMRLCKTDGVSRFLPRIDTSDLYTEFYGAVEENDEDIFALCRGEETVGLAVAANDGKQGYLYVYIFPEYRHLGHGRTAVRLAEQQILSPEMKKIYTSYSVKDEAARRFAEHCGYPEKYASAHMTYHGERFELPELPIRQYEDGDYEAAFALSAEAFHKMRLGTGCFPDSVLAQPSEESRKSWAETAKERYVYVADGEIVGFAHVDGPELDSASIKISRQGKGCGKRFIQYLVNLVLKNETEAPYLWCVVGNNKARRLYDALGFEEDFCEAFAIKKTAEDASSQN